MSALWKESHDKLNDMLIEKNEIDEKIKQLEAENQRLQKENEWLTSLYRNFVARVYDELDEICYHIKHSSIPEEKSKNT